MSKHSLKGKKAFIAGGAKNLGGLLSRDFAAEGAKVCLHYNSAATKADAEKTVAEIQAAGGEAFAVSGDFTKAANVVKAFAEAKEYLGGLDIAVNTIGKVLKKPFLETTEEEYDSMAAINSKAAYFFIQEAGKQLNDGGKICTIVTSLLAAYTGLYSTYGGMKAPVEHFTRAASKEFVISVMPCSALRVSAICPAIAPASMNMVCPFGSLAIAARAMARWCRPIQVSGPRSCRRPSRCRIS